MHSSRRALLGLLATLTLPLAAQGASQENGFYLGATLGAGKGKSEAKAALSGSWSTETASLRSDVVNAWSKDLDGTGVLAGIQAGYRQTLSNNIVLGVELNLDTLSAKKSLATGPVATPSFPTLTYALDTTVELKQPMSLEAKVGYQSGPHMPFLTLGFVRAKAEASNQIISNGGYRKAGNGSENVSGFQWGIGYEFRFNQQWSGNAAFTTASLGDFKYDTAYLPGSAFTSPAYGETFTHKMSLTTFRVGVNYHF